ncbi:hypothetical protein BDD43_5158 [Mucilaginibacter gracilis]|uniref:Uncharacterized protein n=1 Tax=Mucilaginibacter gracilis TaxID=423350 RepID=A0A495J7E0_9SPHI|nr:hypothetical protein [Mucilaginibacter gracilis]RKR84905.1 hypothetical protein BDD43_5158 [Mucilaginibacter gracilis]
MFQTLLQLKNNGTLKQLVLNGFMSPKIFMYLEIYLWVDARIQTTGKSLSTIVSDAEIVFSVSSATIWRSLRIAKDMAADDALAS